MESLEITYLLKLLRKVFPDPDLLKFFIRSCSTFLEGKNSKKVFYVWWGSGNNCKTGMATLVQSSLGEYCATVPVSLITGKRSSSSDATPELCHIEGKLAVFLQEPNPKEKIKTGRIKELTGNDKIFVRNLYQTGREIDIKCKIIHVCNFPTASPDTDVAFKRRMKVIKFPSTFLEPQEYNRQKLKGILSPNTFRTQDNIENVFKALGGAFLHLMVMEYKVFLERGLETPKIVDKHTEEFLVHGNLVLKFIRKQLKHEKNGGKSTIDTLYRLFKEWIKIFYPTSFTPNSEMFIKELHDEGFQDKNGDGIIENIIISDSFIEIEI
jgi:phage/plasmid-associated DNA primase